MVVGGQGYFLVLAPFGIKADVNSRLWCRQQVTPMVNRSDSGINKGPGETFGGLQKVAFGSLFYVEGLS